MSHPSEEVTATPGPPPPVDGPVADPAVVVRKPANGYWTEVWRRYRRRPIAMVALAYVVTLSAAALFSPAIVGTKPIVCKYKGDIYFPALGYYNRRWEPAIFTKDRFRNRYKGNLEAKDPDSWAIWPLVFQDPNRRVREGEWPDQPSNPAQDQGSPSGLNYFGTNRQGVDLFAQIIHGARAALLVGFVSMGIASVIGMTLGAMAGYFGGWADTVLSRVIEVVMCIPQLVLVLALTAVVEKPTIWHIMIVLGLTGWTSIARLTRAEFLRLRESDFVAAARALGAGPLRIIYRHIFRNALAPVLVPITFGIASAILVESALRFLGFGPATPSWGQMISDSRNNLGMWWMTIFPGGAIFLTVLAYNLIGEGLQMATDPRLKQSGH